MRRQSSAEIAAIAGRRLERLGRAPDLDPAAPAVVPVPVPAPVPAPVRAPVSASLPALVPEPGRHARHRPPPPGERAGAWVGRRLPTLVGTVRLRAAHLTALLLVAVLALAATAWWAVHGSSDPVPVARTSAAVGAPVSTTSAASATPASEPLAGAASPVAASPTGGPGANAASGVVVVDVAGKVRRPGIATLPAGSRVIDALRRAGGAANGVDLTSLNLARVLSDGEQILVGLPAGAAPAPGAGATSVSTSGGGSAGSAGAAGTVNLNTASVDGLEELPGVGPVTAQKIVDWRTQHGAFRSIDELLEVDGIGPKTLANLAPHATL